MKNLAQFQNFLFELLKFVLPYKSQGKNYLKGKLAYELTISYMYYKSFYLFVDNAPSHLCNALCVFQCNALQSTQ